VKNGTDDEKGYDEFSRHCEDRYHGIEDVLECKRCSGILPQPQSNLFIPPQTCYGEVVREVWDGV